MRGASPSDGYTLAEMLAALLIVGLTMGGLAGAGFLVGRLQLGAAKAAHGAEAAGEVQARFSGLLEGQGPYTADADDLLQGDADSFSFACREASCGASVAERGDIAVLTLRTPARSDIKLGATHAPHFLYVSARGEQDSWPPEGEDDRDGAARDGQPQHLTAILLASQDGEGLHPIASARVWRQEPPGCRFDVIAKACRSS